MMVRRRTPSPEAGACMSEPYEAATPPAPAWRAEAGAVLRLGAPMALTQLVQFAVNTIDVLMIGRLGAEPLAASALGVVLFYVAWLIGFGPAMAVSPLVSQALGANANAIDDVRRTVRMALWAVFLLFPFVFAFYLAAPQIVRWLGQPASLAELAGPYVVALAPGLPFFLGVIVLRNFLAAIGKTIWPLIIIVFATLLNAGLNWLLIFGALGFPRLELVGAGIASSISHAVGFAALCVYIRLDPDASRFALFRAVFNADWERFRQVVRLGWPIGVSTAFEGTLFNACVFIMGRIGTVEVAAYQVALNVAALAFMTPLGLSMAGAVRVGLAAGAEDWRRARHAAAATIGLSIAAILVFAVPVAVAPAYFASLYLSPESEEDLRLLALVADFLRVATLFMIFDATQVAANQALRGLKDVRAPMVLTGIAYWVVGFPLAASLGLASPLGAIGVWWGLLVALGLAATLLAFRLWSRLRPATAR